MRTYDKSLTEVWEWKEGVYSETKGLSAGDYIRKTTEDSDAVLSESHVDLTSISSSSKREKVA
jgi:hypothetical protein